MKISVRGQIVAPDGEKENRREISVRDKVEYDKLPFDKYPITHATKREGIGVTLTDGRHECEASFHRYGKGSRYGEVFYIGSANRRLRSNDYTKKFRRFLEEVGTIDVSTFVKLEFEAYTIYISKV